MEQNATFIRYRAQFPRSNLRPHPKDIPMDAVVTELEFICCRKKDDLAC